MPEHNEKHPSIDPVREAVEANTTGILEDKIKSLDERIAAQPYEKVTMYGIKSRVVKTEFIVLPNSTVTLCNITLENGFSVRGESACVDKRNFNMKIGEELAEKDALSKMWELDGYLLAERKWQAER